MRAGTDEYKPPSNMDFNSFIEVHPPPLWLSFCPLQTLKSWLCTCPVLSSSQATKSTGKQRAAPAFAVPQVPAAKKQKTEEHPRSGGGSSSSSSSSSSAGIVGPYPPPMPENDEEDEEDGGEDQNGEHSEHNRSSRYYDHDEDDEEEEEDTQTRIAKLVESGAQVRGFHFLFFLFLLLLPWYPFSFPSP